jgi:DNA invertase Pin-like site-specific DNA recombinase
MADPKKTPSPAKIREDPAVQEVLRRFRKHGRAESMESGVDDDLLRWLWRAQHVDNPRRLAGGYPRLSQAKGTALATEVSLFAQVKDICRKALELDWRIVDWYIDYESASAFALRPRPEFTRLLNDLNGGVVNAVAAYNIDRAFRLGTDLEPILVLAEAGKCEVATAAGSGALDLQTAGGRLTARILVMMATHESETISRRQKAHALELARRGAFPGGSRSYGFERVSEPGKLPTLRIIPAEAEMIKAVYDRILNQGWTIQAVMRWMNAEREAGTPGFETIRGGAWRRATIRQMLVVPYLAGLREHAPTRVERVPGDETRRRQVRIEPVTRYPAIWEGIVTAGELDAMRALLYADDRKTNWLGNRGGSRALSGFVVCECGTKMYTSSTRNKAGERVPRYGCVSANGGCGRLSRNAEHLEAIARDLVIVALADGRIAAAAAPGIEPGDERTLEMVQGEIDRLEEQRLDMADRLGDGDISNEMFDRFNSRANERLALLQEELTELLEDSVVERPAGDPEVIARMWDDGDVGDRQDLMRAANIMIQVGPMGRGRHSPMTALTVLDAEQFRRDNTRERTNNRGRPGR